MAPHAGRVLRGHRRDIWGVGFVTLGLVSALGVYFDAAGPVGNAVTQFFGAVVGLLRGVLPLLFIIVGLVLIRGHLRGRAEERAAEESPDGAATKLAAADNDLWVRFSIGGLLSIVAAAGLVHLGAGRPAFGDDVDGFVDAGGFLGWLIGAPVRAMFGAWGAPVVLVALLIVGVVVFTAVSIARWFSRGARRVEALGGFVQQFWCLLVGVDPTAIAVASTESADAAGVSSGLPPEQVVAETPAPIIVGGQQVGEYRRADATVAPLDIPRGHVGVGDPLLENLPSPESRKFRSLAQASGIRHVDAEMPGSPAIAHQSGPRTAEQPAVPKSAVRDRQPKAANKPASSADERVAPAKAAPRRKPKVVVSDTAAGEQGTLDLRPSVADSPWKLPPLNLLNRSKDRAVDQTAVTEAGQTLERALASHGVDAHLVGMVVGPTVTRYELELGDGVKVARITSLSRDIAYAMASADVRILAPIPGRQAIGIEVPNENRQVVALGDLLRSNEAMKAEHPLEVAIGRDIQGKAKLMNLAKMPHLLIAGATGSGKSSCINSIITSVLMRSTPADVRMILVDPKMVEMTQYENVPHLLTQPVTDPRKAANALAWACREMDRRYELLAGKGFRDIAGFNKAFDEGNFDEENTEVERENETANPGEERRKISRLPFILVVVDELADLMMVAARDVEDSICRIAQKARAVGIHLVIATQRPATNVITGIIKANVPARMAFSVSSLTDSRVILDQPGAERLIGQGDLLMLSPTSSAADRIQGCWVEEEEVRKVVKNWRKQAADFKIDESVSEAEIVDGSTSSSAGGSAGGTSSGASDDDDLYARALELVVTSQLGSTSMLQRKLKVGFARAGRLMDMLEENNIVGPSIGSKAREVLIGEEDL